MSDLVVFVVVVAAMAGVGIWLGMIVAGRIDQRMAPRAAEPPRPPEPPTTPSVPQEESS
ncbi:MAG: hypothetical protein ACYDAN_14705 [Candidatus Limnocylindrales bacterium]